MPLSSLFWGSKLTHPFEVSREMLPEGAPRKSNVSSWIGYHQPDHTFRLARKALNEVWSDFQTKHEPLRKVQHPQAGRCRLALIHGHEIRRALQANEDDPRLLGTLGKNLLKLVREPQYSKDLMLGAAALTAITARHIEGEGHYLFLQPSTEAYTDDKALRLLQAGRRQCLEVISETAGLDVAQPDMGMGIPFGKFSTEIDGIFGDYTEQVIGHIGGEIQTNLNATMTPRHMRIPRYTVLPTTLPQLD